jgi:hypothetical protein
LVAAGWTVEVEATFQVWGERGSIDILAWHATTRTVLVVEVKSTVPDVQGLLAGLNRKTRIASVLARDRHWAGGQVSRLLVLPDDRTARRRVQALASTFEAVLPERGIAVRRWIRSPGGRPLAGILFLPNLNPEKGRQRVARRCPGATHGDPGHR